MGKPDWDKLMGAYAGSATQLIGDDDKKAEIAKIQAMPAAELEAAIVEEEKKMEEAEAEFKTEVQKLQDRYTALNEEKDAKVEAVKASGLGLMKAVKASGPPEGNDEL